MAHHIGSVIIQIDQCEEHYCRKESTIMIYDPQVQRFSCMFPLIQQL